MPHCSCIKEARLDEGDGAAGPHADEPGRAPLAIHQAPVLPAAHGLLQDACRPRAALIRRHTGLAGQHSSLRASKLSVLGNTRRSKVTRCAPARACEDALSTAHLCHSLQIFHSCKEGSRHTLGGEVKGSHGAAGLQGSRYQANLSGRGAPLVVKSKADAVPPVRSHQLTVRWRCASWL